MAEFLVGSPTSPVDDITSPASDDGGLSGYEVLEDTLPQHTSLVAKQYLSKRMLDELWPGGQGLPANASDEARFDGIALINKLRQQLGMPVRTYFTACDLFHRYRLYQICQGQEGQPDPRNVAIAVLHAAARMEDTPKKIPDMLLAAYNLGEHPDFYNEIDPEILRKHTELKIIPEEECLVKALRIDFRRRVHPHKLLIKLLKSYGFEKQSKVARTAYFVCQDLYFTWEPLMKPPQVLALTSIEFAGRIHNIDPAQLPSSRAEELDALRTSPKEVLETLLVLFLMYFEFRTRTSGMAYVRNFDRIVFATGQVRKDLEGLETNAAEATPPRQNGSEKPPADIADDDAIDADVPPEAVEQYMARSLQTWPDIAEEDYVDDEDEDEWEDEEDPESDFERASDDDDDGEPDPAPQPPESSYTSPYGYPSPTSPTDTPPAPQPTAGTSPPASPHALVINSHPYAFSPNSPRVPLEPFEYPTVQQDEDGGTVRYFLDPGFVEEMQEAREGFEEEVLEEAWEEDARGGAWVRGGGEGEGRVEFGEVGEGGQLAFWSGGLVVAS